MSVRYERAPHVAQVPSCSSINSSSTKTMASNPNSRQRIGQPMGAIDSKLKLFFYLLFLFFLRTLWVHPALPAHMAQSEERVRVAVLAPGEEPRAPRIRDETE